MAARPGKKTRIVALVVEVKLSEERLAAGKTGSCAKVQDLNGLLEWGSRKIG